MALLTKENTIIGVNLGGIAAAFHRVIVEHNTLSGCALILWSFYPKSVFKVIHYVVWKIPKSIGLGFVRCLGFGRDGVGRDTYASRYQSRYYEDYIPADSLFASYQSYGAIGDNDYVGRHDEEEVGFVWGVFSWALLIGGICIMIRRIP